MENGLPKKNILPFDQISSNIDQMLSSLMNRYCPLLIKYFSSYWSDIVSNLPNWRLMIECTPADFRVNCSESIQFSTDLFSLPLIYMIVMILYWQLWMLPASNMIAENVKRLRAVYLQLLISSDWYLKCVSEWSLITEWSRVKRHHPYQRVLCTRSFSMRKKTIYFHASETNPHTRRWLKQRHW